MVWTELDTFTRAYLEAALWSSLDWTDEDGDTPMDTRYGIEDMAESTLIQAKADCTTFREKAGGLLAGLSDEQGGHDFWLTRNHHGAGFWDRGMGAAGEGLTALAQDFKELDLEVGDDKQIYFFPLPQF